MKKTIMGIGAHADDLESNIGGALAKYHDKGYKISYVLATNNMSGNWCKIAPDGKIEYTKPKYDVIIKQRKLEADLCAGFFGTTPIHLNHPQRHYFDENGVQKKLTFGCERPDCVASDIPTILTAYEDKNAVNFLKELILKEDPEAVITHSPIMINIEHFATCLLVANAYWAAVKEGFGGIFMQWLDISPSIFGERFMHWDTFVDTSDYFEEKLKAVGLNACQIPRPEALDYPCWGTACGCRHAEVFTVAAYGAPQKIHGEFKTEILRNSNR